MELLRIFDEFRLEELDDNWIKAVWESEFLAYDNIPLGYIDYVNSEDMDVLLKSSSVVIKEWISNGKRHGEIDSERIEVSWQTLISLNVNPRTLLPVLGYIIKNGQSSDADEDSRQSCLKACDLYFILLSVPGSNAFQVFHPNLYYSALKIFEFSEHLVQRSQRFRPTTDLEDLYDTETDIGDLLFATEKLTLIKGLNCLMFDVATMLKEFCLCDHPRSLEITVHLLFKVAKLARDVICFGTETRRMEASIDSLAYNAYMALYLLCNSNHGPIEVTIQLIAKYVLPNLISNQDELLTKDLFAIRQTLVNFLEKIMETHREEAQLGITTLIQHLMVKCSEKVDARLKLATLILRLMNNCDKKVHITAIGDLIALAHHNKVTQRIFAQEIMGKFLADSTAGDKSSLDQKIRKLIFATVLSRCKDCSSLVRGKALSIVAECTNPQNIQLTTIKNFFQSSDPDRPLSSSDMLQRAISEDIDPLPGSTTIFYLLVARVDDERAFVRRSALQTLSNLVHLFTGLLNTLIATLGLHCRDPAIIVRCYSVKGFTQLVENFPEHPLLPQEWVKHVLPQIFDVEVKVQEKVLESLEQLMLNNIKYFNDENNNSALFDLPWLILNQITEQKMRKHLAKACAVWSKNSTLTDSLIEKIKSHLASANNTPAWVLLATIVKYKELPSMNHHILNYKEILCQDTFEANLIIEVLRNSWSKLDDSFLKTLRFELFESLGKFQISFNLVGICYDLFTDLTKYLYPDEGDKLLIENSLFLMKLSETRVEKILEYEDGTEDTLHICLKAMSTLGNASHLCTGSISPSTLRTLQGLVVEWDSLPEGIKCMGELRAAAVTVLGKQAMRDREIAQEILPILGHMMRACSSQNSTVEAAVKVNAAKALADICIRFTALVEPYLLDMCISMKDSNPTIREAIMVLFIQLLLEDFIKVKGPFFFHILTMLTDTDEMVRDLTVFLVNERLLAKNKTLIYRQFLECIFHYNNYRMSNELSSNVISPTELASLTLPGRRNRSQRRMIYNFMLGHLEPSEKPKIIARLTSEILRAVIRGTINIQKEEGLSLLKDCLYILSREELHPASCSKRNNNDDSQDERENMENLPTDNIAGAIANDMTKQRIDILIPTLVKLKKILAKIHSPLTNYVAKFYIDIFTEYKEEQLIDLFGEHPDLKNEIEMDCRKYGSESIIDNVDDIETSEQQSNHTLITQERMPRIVLRRLSTLTYPGINNRRSPSHFFQSDRQSCESSSSQTSLKRYLEVNSPPLSQPRPSNGTPTSSKPGQFYCSPICSPIITRNRHSFKNLKRKDLSIISNNEETTPNVSDSLTALKKKNVVRKLCCDSNSN